MDHLWTHGLLVPKSSGGYRADTLAWKTAVESAGGTAAANILAAVDDFFEDLEIASLTAKVLRLNLFAGDQLAAALVPQIATIGGTTEVNVNFVAGDYTPTSGLDPGASNSTKYIRTGIIPNAIAAFATGCSFGFWISVARHNFLNWSTAMGVGDVGGAGTDQVLKFYENGASLYRNYTAYGASVQTNIGSGYANGLHVGSRLVAGSRRIYLNGSGVITASTSDTDDTRSANEIRVFATLGNGYTSWCEQPSYGYFVGSDLLNDDVMNLYNSWATFNTALSRS